MHVGKTNGGGGKEVREARKQEDEEQVEVRVFHKAPFSRK